ncbi:MAG: electron transporter RnfD [Crocinitomicaceae bacterium]|nr:electron transporter RnfD [Crocinitomicaceae bacterium]|tara:strand:+ start:3232 stop:4239 length:1008 start_codon:yes stop_codon:yes gene_type:complete
MIGDKLSISTAPFLKDDDSTPKIMFLVVYTLMPVVAVSFYFFGLAAILVTITSVFSCMFTEWVFNTSGDRSRSLKDGSGLITGLLLALTLPPGFPLWMVFLGGVVAIGMGKVIWGGLGQNVFNPALLGRAFLQAAFPTAITTWSPPDGRFFGLRGTNLAMPMMQGKNIDGATGATPLAKMKFEQVGTDTMDLLLGNTGGSLGETCGILLILAGIFLLVRKIINWRIPLSIVLTVSIFSGIFWMIDPARYPSPVFMILSGGMLLGTVYMATDLVTSPLTPKGCWVFGIGIGLLIVLIRNWGGLPEGVMYAILLMNAATPLINKYTKIRTYGHEKAK